MGTDGGSDGAFHFQQALLPEGWADNVRLTVRDGVIATLERNATPQAGDERQPVAVPGLPNLHSHAFQRGMAGLAEVRGPAGDSFWTWRDVMYRFVDRLSPDDLHAIAALAYMEMLEAGFTRVGEFHYLHHDRDGGRFADPAEMSAAIVAAADETGIALTHLPVFYAHSGFGGAAPGHGQRRFLHDLDGFARLLDAARTKARALPDAVVGVAPHSLRAVTPEELTEVAGLAGAAPVHIHVAEQVKEVEDCVAWGGGRPVEWLLANVAVDARWCLVHATHVTPAEVADMAARGAVVGLCPITEANLGDGIFPAPAYLSAGGRFGVGSDSNVLIDATEELRLLEYGQRLAGRSRNVMARAPGRSTGQDLMEGALAGGAAALGAPSAIAVGHAADLVSLDTQHPSLHGRRGPALLDALIFAAGRTAIDGVWRRGKQVVNTGRHQRRDAIVTRYRQVLERLTQ
ncbi:formimidoylglutamate deiminase [Nitrospirillum viridazoti]|uniref:Formimidoylglutamate deiminase n=1 Tax=Nitrospirillum viridazoti CBAmc TaxID=1441467 RepID=A0A248K0P5_9PROT|nr:formimidoylglutamate deiminase [Nitrospirillum amazonense]ASG24512.1 formimidoylglutamate deiminase [Nitrospirillum amazonense CBAmc]TWB37142.1 formimidoylglutamate deiminase [Nitrospirillum amazonense]